MRSILLLSFILCLGATLHSQEDIFDDAEFFYSMEEYEEAAYLFSQLSKQFPENTNLSFRVGMSYLNIPGQETRAIPYLEKAVQNTTMKYKEREFKIKKAPHHAWFYLGNAYRINNELDKALETYEIFMDIRNFERKYNLRIVENEIDACQRAKIIKDSPVKIARNALPEIINASGHNFQPVVNRDESIIVYMQRQKFYDAIFFSYKDEGSWTNPVNITPQVGSDGDMIPTGISPDGKMLLLIKEATFGNGDVFISYLEGNFWSKAREIKSINTLRDEDHASFSSDGKQILFSSNRRGGFGKHDLYISNKKENDSWSSPENLGPAINTEEDETSGFFAVNDKHLYFASKGHFNMGGYDIFFSEKEDNSWTDPVNIGFPLNTTGDDKFYQPVKNGNIGYVALFDSETGNQERIYRVEVAPLAKINLPEETLLNKNLKIELINPETGEIIYLEYQKNKDRFSIRSNRETEYELKIKNN